MSSTTKKKHVCREVLDEYVLPTGNQEIVRVQAGRGNNLHEVTDAEGKSFLVSMPTKFRKSVWIKRGDFVIVEPIEEGDKVQAEIIVILYRDQIRYIKRENMWPTGFDADEIIEKSPSPFPGGDSTTPTDDDNGAKPSTSGVPSEMLPPSDDEDEDYDSDDEFVVVNPNRPQAPVYESSSEEEEDSDEEEEDSQEEEEQEEEEEDKSSTVDGVNDRMKRCHLVSTQAQCKG